MIVGRRSDEPKVAIVDYGVGNLFSIKKVCKAVGLNGGITCSTEDIIKSDGVILPGVGAFGDAINRLEEMNLIDVLKTAICSSKPFMGICLGMQLLMSESYEFGRHRGLNIIRGTVRHLGNPVDASGKRLKVPQVGWNKIIKPTAESEWVSWKASLLEGFDSSQFIYFVHSYYVVPEDKRIVLSMSQYGDIVFCSSIQQGNVFGCQFHPECSGSYGLKIYENFETLIKNSKNGRNH